MTGPGVLTLIIFAALLVGAVFLVLRVVPQMAHSRLVLELSKVRTAIFELGEEEPIVLAHPDVQRLDAILARTLAWGRAPGLSSLVSALISVRRLRSTGEPLPAAATYEGLGASQRLALYLLMHRTSLAIIRASVFGSQLWFLAWPIWVVVRAGVSRHETLERGVDDDRALTRVVDISTDHDQGRFLQMA